jgi:hypothetical protein
VFTCILYLYLARRFLLFGRPQQNPNNPAHNGQSAPKRPATADVSQIEGGGLVQLIVTSLSPLTFYLFLNDQPVSQMDVESLNIVIEAPTDADPTSGMIRATLARYVDAVTGGKTQQRTELFPCTLELIALRRRLCVICQNPNSFDGLFVTVGLKPDGTDSELKGVHALNVLLTEGILDAKITWNEGDTENVFPLV